VTIQCTHGHQISVQFANDPALAGCLSVAFTYFVVHLFWTHASSRTDQNVSYPPWHRVFLRHCPPCSLPD